MSLSAVFKYTAKQAVVCINMLRIKVWHTHTTVWLLKNYIQRILTYYTRILLLDLTYGRTVFARGRRAVRFYRRNTVAANGGQERSLMSTIVLLLLHGKKIMKCTAS